MLTHRSEASVQARGCSAIRSLVAHRLLWLADEEDGTTVEDDEDLPPRLAPDIVAAVLSAMRDWRTNEEVQVQSAPATSCKRDATTGTHVWRAARAERVWDLAGGAV
eukprot:985768-Rhodomonas_salina.4